MSADALETLRDAIFAALVRGDEAAGRCVLVRPLRRRGCLRLCILRRDARRRLLRRGRIVRTVRRTIPIRRFCARASHFSKGSGAPRSKSSRRL